MEKELTILKNLSGNFYGIFVNIFNQILLIPYYIKFWGVDMYSDWIALTAISNFFTMSDIGLNTVTNNQYSIAFNNGKFYECKALLANNALLIIVVFVGTIILVLPCCLSGLAQSVLSLRVIPYNKGFLVVSALVFKIFLSMQIGVCSSIYRAVSKAYIPFYLKNTSSLIESIIILVCVILKCDVVLIAALFCIPNIILLIYMLIDTKINYNEVINFRYIDLKVFKEILKPSIAFMSFPLGYAVIMQGFTLIVNKYFGASDVVLYNTTRTMCNFIKVIPNAIKNAVWPEFTIAFAKSDFDKMILLHKKTLIVTSVIITCIAFVFCSFGDYIYKIWLGDSVNFSLILMVTYMISIIFNTLWETSGMTLMATNQHSKMGTTFLVLSVFSFLGALGCSKVGCSLFVIVIMVLFVDVIMSLYVLRRSRSLLFRMS